MASVSVRLTGTKRLRKALRRAGLDAERHLGRALYAEGEKVVAKAKRLVPVDLGALRASGHVRSPERTPGGVVVTLGFGGAAAPYAVYVHEGTGPAVGRPRSMPPEDAIREWVQRNLRIRYSSLKTRTARSRKLRKDELDDAVQAVRWAIYQRGTRPTKYLERPLREAERGMAGRVARHVERAMGAGGGAAR